VTHVSVLAAPPGFDAPGPVEFKLPDILGGNQILLTKSSLLLVLAAIIVFVGFYATARKAAVVPSKLQYAGESAYSWVRDSVGRDVIGEKDFIKYVPLLVTIFFFVLVNNLYELTPFLQFPSFSRVSFAYGLAAIVWIIYNGIGMVRHGPLGYLRNQCVPSGVPVAILPLLIPLEFLSNIVVRPITLSLRLFANMFAGHLLLLLFSSGADYLLIHASGPLVKPAGVVSFLMGIAVGFLEFIVGILQAYVFALLTSTYVAGSLAEHH
jgi:F-type H+-transporting ATPase subunit a